MNPIIILPENAMSADDIKRLNDNGICVVSAKDPAAVKFVDPIPSAAQRTKIEDAAIELSRKLLGPWKHELPSMRRSEVAQMYVELLTKGTPLGQDKEREQKLFDDTKFAEIQQLARQEAREERAKIKAEKAAQRKESQRALPKKES